MVFESSTNCLYFPLAQIAGKPCWSSFSRIFLIDGIKSMTTDARKARMPFVGAEAARNQTCCDGEMRKDTSKATAETCPRSPRGQAPSDGPHGGGWASLCARRLFNCASGQNLNVSRRGFGIEWSNERFGAGVRFGNGLLVRVVNSVQDPFCAAVVSLPLIYKPLFL